MAKNIIRTRRVRTIGKKPYKFGVKPYRIKYTPYSAEKLFKSHRKAGRPAKKKPTTPRIVKQRIHDAQSKKQTYPSGGRIYSGVTKTRPYDLRLPSKHLKKPYSLTALYPHKKKKPVRPTLSGGRVYAWRGPYPNPLGLNEIFSVELNKWGRKALFEREMTVGTGGGIYGGKGRMDTKEREKQIKMIRFIVNKLRELHYDMKEYGETIIDRKIPIRTGTMRKKMKGSLSKSNSIIPRPAKMEMKMFLKADVKYAGVVTGMDRIGSPHVAHTTSIYPNYPNAIDPHAVKKGYYVVLRDLKNYFRKLWRGFKYELEEGFKRNMEISPIAARMYAAKLFDVKVQGRTWKF